MPLCSHLTFFGLIFFFFFKTPSLLDITVLQVIGIMSYMTQFCFGSSNIILCLSSYVSVCLFVPSSLTVREEKNQWALSAPEDHRWPPITHPISLTQAPYTLPVSHNSESMQFTKQGRAIKSATFHICIAFMEQYHRWPQV